MFMVNHLVGFGVVSSAPSLRSVADSLGLTTNLKLCLDAGDAQSYTSGQSWLDRSGNGYDFFRGADGSATATDPTFNGVAGNLSETEYFSVDGGDYFTYDTTNETWMQNLHKNNAVYTLVGWIRPASLAAAAPVIGTRGGSGGEIGILFGLNGSGKVQINVVNGSGNALSLLSDFAVSNTTWHMIGISLNEATGAGGGFLYLDGNYAQVSSADTFDSTYSSPSASNASQTMNLLSFGGGNTPAHSGARLAGVMAWEGTAHSKATLDAIWAATRHRFYV